MMIEFIVLVTPRVVLRKSELSAAIFSECKIKNKSKRLNS
jgi:hypothetical protein